MKKDTLSLSFNTNMAIAIDTYWEVRNSIDVGDFSSTVNTDSFFVSTDFHKMIPCGLEDS